MSIINRRNAMLGWAAWKVGKSAMKMRAKGAVPGRSKSGGRMRMAAMLAGAAAAAAGAVALVRHRKSGDADLDE